MADDDGADQVTQPGGGGQVEAASGESDRPIKKREDILLRLIGKMRESDSWGGETHIQKSVFFLQHLLKVPLPYQFVIHLHGPYSFELRDDLTRLRARNKLQVQPNPGYGASLAVDPSVDIDNLSGEEFTDRIRFVSTKISTKYVRDLERIGTAYFLRHVASEPRPDSRLAEELRRLKPHIAQADAERALEEVKELLQKWRG